MEKTYDIEVDDVRLTSFLDNSGWTNSSSTLGNTTTGSIYYYPWSGYWYPETKYLYQIKCPKVRCKTSNWLELNKEQACKKCGSILRAVSKRVDFEIEID